jgi:hypothetical protein
MAIEALFKANLAALRDAGYAPEIAPTGGGVMCVQVRIGSKTIWVGEDTDSRLAVETDGVEGGLNVEPPIGQEATPAWLVQVIPLVLDLGRDFFEFNVPGLFRANPY